MRGRRIGCEFESHRIQKKILNFLFFIQKFFHYLKNIFYTQIAIFLRKYLIVGKKVRFEPIVHEMNNEKLLHEFSYSKIWQILKHFAGTFHQA